MDFSKENEFYDFCALWDTWVAFCDTGVLGRGTVFWNIRVPGHRVSERRAASQNARVTERHPRVPRRRRPRTPPTRFVTAASHNTIQVFQDTAVTEHHSRVLGRGGVTEHIKMFQDGGVPGDTLMLS